MQEDQTKEAITAVLCSTELAIKGIELVGQLSHSSQNLGEAKEILEHEGYPIIAQLLDFFTDDQGECMGAGVLGDILSGRLTNY